jgi:hypothetical protein
METGDLAVYQPPEGERWIQAKCSFDGKRIVFIAMPLIGNKEDIENAQIAIMDVNGKNIRKITKTPGLKIYPRFPTPARRSFMHAPMQSEKVDARQRRIMISMRWMWKPVVKSVNAF